ncbi:D-isomer specific 2-hydroxyacid dehydrogenase NAD-binding protein [Nitritalea halalkaliphila LW7]|uniref:D-isomer specific 2-hydroxyacid dehydrogenase NAD-binding protein n=1 Tax=Nitritalea halalkaliphila LW7 TaxID=1189621 RepID=I5BXQ1_9BACT|nr:glyoxylate/hydroxypyruvate reductase A [Nitritalea halalkaliphila]EIM74353.1 D-isomer specific 2-hydroxyacid dehydrogenase NAD-binding protein [Nitritalea halalkaliphila LW7]
MSIFLLAPGKELSPWKKAFHREAPEIPLLTAEDSPQRIAEAKMAVLWQHPSSCWEQLPALQLIASMGAGVDHLLQDPMLPERIPIMRIVDEGLSQYMSSYVLWGILQHHRRASHFAQLQTQQRWNMDTPTHEIRVGVMGVGALGMDVIRKCQALQIPVVGYGNSPRANTDFPYYAAEQLPEFLQAANVLVCLLPLTPKTEGILNATLFEACTPGTYLINVGRGRHLVEEDLLPAIEAGQLSGALLDVFRQEPLPEGHPFWSHPALTLTPHISSVTNPDAAVPQLVENYRRIQKNEPLIHLVSRERGY